MASLLQCVSIPRSGHHFLIKLLRAYFNDRSTNTQRMTYCEFYHCCKTRPCRLYDSEFPSSHARVHVQKSHDEFLRRRDKEHEPPFEISNQGKHLVQFRHPIPSTISEFIMVNKKLRERQKNEDATIERECAESNPIPPPTVADWLLFSTRDLEYRNRFLEKWILRNPWVESDQYFFLNYDHLLAHPHETLCEVIRFARPDEIVNPSRVEAALAKRSVKPKRNPQKFEFASTLDEFEPLCADIWKACKEKLKMNR